MKRLRLEHEHGRCEVYVGSGAVRHAAAPGSAIIVADRRLAGPRRALRRSLAAAGARVTELCVTAGEPLKSLPAVSKLYGALLDARADRSTTLYALGGGSVGDAAGFVASTFFRGIEWVGVPTTLLAQVDSSVGGKTALNHPRAKNAIGTFHPPARVACDTDFLATLSGRDHRSGVGEIIKCALALDPAFFARLEADLTGLLAGEPKVLSAAMVRALELKCAAVEADERDLSGEREKLNFGHTFGHALEAVTGYRVYRHGEAVLWGMRFAVALSQVRGWLAASEAARADALLARVPVPPLAGRRAQLFERMKADKKSIDGKVSFVLLKRLGRCVRDRAVTPRDLERAHDELLRKAGAA